MANKGHKYEELAKMSRYHAIKNVLDVINKGFGRSLKYSNNDDWCLAYDLIINLDIRFDLSGNILMPNGKDYIQTGI